MKTLKLLSLKMLSPFIKGGIVIDSKFSRLLSLVIFVSVLLAAINSLAFVIFFALDKYFSSTAITSIAHSPWLMGNNLMSFIEFVFSIKLDRSAHYFHFIIAFGAFFSILLALLASVVLSGILNLLSVSNKTASKFNNSVESLSEALKIEKEAKRLNAKIKLPSYSAQQLPKKVMKI